MAELIAGRYRRRELLGQGGMGEVWLADDLVLGRVVAVKTIRGLSGSPGDRALADRMLREARVASRLQHPNAVTVHDLLVDEGRPTVVMEYVEGETLADRIERDGAVGAAEAARLIGQVAGALEVAHQAGIVHRDIKPANILIDRRGNAKLADFGIARGAGEVSLTEVGQILGTLAYMPPEVARTGVATAASDIWSLGATMYAATEGAAPFLPTGEEAPASLLYRLLNEPAPRPQRAGAAAPLVAAMLATDAEQRPTAAQVHEALTQRDHAPAVVPELAATVVPGVAAGAPTRLDEADRFTTPQPETSTAPRPNRRWFALGAAGVVVAGGVVAIVLSADGGGHPSATGTSHSSGPSSVSSTVSSSISSSTPPPVVGTSGSAVDTTGEIGPVDISRTQWRAAGANLVIELTVPALPHHHADFLATVLFDSDDDAADHCEGAEFQYALAEPGHDFARSGFPKSGCTDLVGEPTHATWAISGATFRFTIPLSELSVPSHVIRFFVVGGTPKMQTPDRVPDASGTFYSVRLP